MKNAYIKCIGNGQITIPKAWRNLLSFDEKPIKATLSGNKIILETMSNEVPEWEISKVRLNTLSSENQKVILSGRNKYLSGTSSQFISSSELLNNI